MTKEEVAALKGNPGALVDYVESLLTPLSEPSTYIDGKGRTRSTQYDTTIARAWIDETFAGKQHKQVGRILDELAGPLCAEHSSDWPMFAFFGAAIYGVVSAVGDLVFPFVRWLVA